MSKETSLDRSIAMLQEQVNVEQHIIKLLNGSQSEARKTKKRMVKDYKLAIKILSSVSDNYKGNVDTEIICNKCLLPQSRVGISGLCVTCTLLMVA